MKKKFCKDMALSTDILLIFTGVAWFCLFWCVADVTCEHFGYSFTLKFIEEYETNPDYDDARNKRYLEKRVKSTGAIRRAKRKAINAISSDLNNSEAHELESLNQGEG